MIKIFTGALLLICSLVLSGCIYRVDVPQGNYLDQEKVEQLMTAYGITLERNKLYDHVYVANMCKADFLGKSVPTEEYLAKYVRDLIDDPDATEGFIFNRFYADCMFMDNPIEWEDMI